MDGVCSISKLNEVSDVVLARDKTGTACTKKKKACQRKTLGVFFVVPY